MIRTLCQYQYKSGYQRQFRTGTRHHISTSQNRTKTWISYHPFSNYRKKAYSKSGIKTEEKKNILEKCLN
jgi:hypothetical protein